MTSIILDTNALLMPFQFSLNIDREIERLFGDVSSKVYVPSSVIRELKGLGKKGALKLSEKYKKIDVEKRGDDGVLEAAERLEGVIVTNDKELKKRALKKKIPVAYLRSRSHLELAGEDWLFTKRGEKDELELQGEVASGVKEGQYFLGLEGYKDRFKDKFGFEPFEGTLNVEVKGEDRQKYEVLKDERGKTIESFVEDGKRFGSVECFPCTIEKKDGDEKIGSNTLLIVPEKTRYDKVVEIVSEYELRKKMDLKDGDEVRVRISLGSEKD
ncbi:MAG: DUF120 domain-containing protein [Candidatus Natronoplasma sp.]